MQYWAQNVFMAIPLICFLCEENELNKSNIIYFAVLLLLLLPIQGIKLQMIFDNILSVFLSMYIIIHIILCKNKN